VSCVVLLLPLSVSPYHFPQIPFQQFELRSKLLSIVKGLHQFTCPTMLRPVSPTRHLGIPPQYPAGAHHLWQCFQPSHVSGYRTEQRRLFEAGWGRTDGTAIDCKFPSPAIPSHHQPTSIDDLRVIIHNRYSVRITTFLHDHACEARSINICSIEI
jgi:hypothetical protein